MTTSEKNQLIEIIDFKVEETRKEISELVELSKPIPLDAAIGRVSRMDAINNKTINEASLREKKKVLQRLEKARERSETKDFGSCQKCGNEIPYGRLEYMPYTTRCVNCADR